MNETEHAALVGDVAVILQRVKYVKLGASLEPIAEEIIDRLLTDRESQLERFARVAMLGAMAIEEIPHIQGVAAVAAYQRWSDTWLTTLTSEDMKYARCVVGLAEPEESSDAS